MTEEVRALRRDHNFSPDDAISCVPRALHRQLRSSTALEEMLGRLPSGAPAFWSVSEPLP